MVAFTQIAWAIGGRVSYPDGKPASGADVKVELLDVGSYSLKTDAAGRFTIPDVDFLEALIQVRGADGQSFTAAALPARMFEGNGVSLVLQPKK
ncbi:carboxypeptidase-like regulatory domain-containing protein [Geomonas oryzae]|uniref:carboxypeptidase-like regulatory domain-containing protein n=1 Tax=Geomonas oryzae TaxID=2364273 RepID=UPI0013A5E120|nr:carboxypeptidase-like regulatory domain-containing protein [Geomonas oryzae]